ncbi:hypothetical protein OII53_28035 [Achromobacter ruhlandii]|uniref:phage baseplate protein n=1 Tax=Achromobacter ruhlandii TaxID=72557 RepID=UPI0021F1F7C9|nr:hypothetical protein [Achromobacter ruhlandii]MCV6799837.1 hypothetical protein [Achromobacter ruhlandii]MCV6801453.1 hypothetical protein [Achromobacter ruhlandii]MCV6812312.1 hypothetical protein [Achromobacter ruhlandii]MCV6822425.1 hypothetical protein [Achromobacter ruhlandii]
MPLIPFPNVPQVPGVPAVLRDLTIPSVSELANLGLGALAALIFGVPRWGLYNQNGIAAVIFDTFLGIRFRNGSRISSFPVEQGSFSSFNKVDTPFDVALRFAHSGDMTSRGELLEMLEGLKASVELLSVVTPEIVYPSANVVGYSYERGPRTGPSQLIFDIYVEEVRVTALADFGETVEPDGTEEESSGQVQTFPVSDPAPVEIFDVSDPAVIDVTPLDGAIQ